MFLALITARRLLELLGAVAFLSVIFMFLFEFVITPYITVVVIIGAVLLGLYFTFQIIALRTCYFGVEYDSVYLITNIAANSLFMLINFFIYAFTNSTFYTWSFGIFKLFHYFGNAGTGMSALFCQIILFLFIFAAPFQKRFVPTNIKPPI